MRNLLLALFLTTASALAAQQIYPLTGTVLTAQSAYGHSYRIASQGHIYDVACYKIKHPSPTPPECSYHGKALAAGDQIFFRFQADSLYIPADADSNDQQLLIFTNSLNTPPTPPADNSGKAVILTTGLSLQSFDQPQTPGPESGPILASPVTGGAPILVNPTGPQTSGVVVGTPVTGGAPIVVTPLTGPPLSPPNSTPWIHLLTLATASKTWQLACPGKLCQLDGHPIDPGQILYLQIDGKVAHLATDANKFSKEKFKILSTTINSTSKN